MVEKIKSFVFKKKYYIIITIIICIAGFLFFQNKKNSAIEKNTRLSSVKKDSLKEVIILSGEVQAHENVKLKFQTGGRLTALSVKQNDFVKKGQFIAALDQRDLQKRLKKELNDYLASRWSFEQGKDDAKNQVITTTLQRVLDQNQFTLENTVLDVELQSIALEFANLFSPIQGIVTSTNSLSPGINILATDTIATIVNPDSIYFEVIADQTEVTKIRENMKGGLKLDAFVDDTIPVSIKSISFSPKTDESGTVYGVDIAFDNLTQHKYKYRLGMTGDVEFIISEKNNVLVVPIDYINEDEKGQFLFTSNDKKDKAYIKTGLETESMVEITDGIAEGTTIYD